MRPRVLFSVKVFGLFSGIGGLELGFHAAGFRTVGMCEVDEACRKVLGRRFPSVSIAGDILELDSLQDADIVVAGFPCQSFSQAGLTDGMNRSHALLKSMFDLIARSGRPHLVFENVPNIVHLDSGAALSYITRRLETLGYTWAYRIVDALEFGVPQRRKRWVMVASVDQELPSSVFVSPKSRSTGRPDARAHGFYWTEGNRGLGWADDAIPPLKGGSGLGIPSPPAIWDRCQHRIVTPHIRDAERLQGFTAGWTDVFSGALHSQRARWRMIGNAVCVPAARFLATALLKRTQPTFSMGPAFLKSGPWPRAAWGRSGERYRVELPLSRTSHKPILEFLTHDPEPLSYRATSGFRQRLIASPLSYPKEFARDLLRHEKLAALAGL